MHHTITTKGDRVYVTIVGDGDSKVAAQFVEDAQKVFDAHPSVVFDVVVDMREAGTSDYAGIKIYKNFLRDAPLKRIAFVVTDEITRSLIQVAVPQRTEETHYFTTTEDAEVWLDAD